MQILIDYENVGSAGLKGTEYLCEDDELTIFYSSSSSSIERQHIEAIEKLCGRFDIIKLQTVRKNGLDFYIAVKVGQIVETYPMSSVLIVTRDNGYQAIKDYCQNYTVLRDRVVIKENIEAGIIAIDADTTRRKTITDKRERLSIESEFSAFEERNKLERDIIDVCKGTEYEDAAPEIMKMLKSVSTPRDRYLSSLRTFGRSDGEKIYRLIRKTV